jgi:hypothetical protein
VKTASSQLVDDRRELISTLRFGFITEVMSPSLNPHLSEDDCPAKQPSAEA